MNMKKLLTLALLLLSTSVLMAQFGDLQELRKQEEADKEGDSLPEEKESSLVVQFIEKAVAQGLVVIRQDYQLEDTITEKRYNYGDDQKKFGGQTAFMAVLDNGFVIPDEILHPWDYDQNYPSYKNKQYVPVFNRTSLLKVAQNSWKALEVPFWPNEVGELANGLKYAKDTVTSSNGFHRFSGFGQKEVWIVWLLFSEDESSTEAHCEYVTEQMELTLEKGKKNYKMEAPDSQLTVLGGVVVEPVINGIGRIDFTLVGVVGKSDGEFQMALIEPNMAEEISVSDGGSVDGLTPSEEVDTDSE